MKSDNIVWESIADEIRQISPELHKTFNPPATTSDIDGFERQFNVRLPEAFRSYLRVFDGQTQEGENFPLIGYNRFLSIAEISRKLIRQIELLGDNPPLEQIAENKIRPVLWDKQWIPFAESDDSGWLILDFNAGKNGQNGQVVLLYPGVDMSSDEIVVSVSFGDFGREFLRRLKNNDFEIDEDDDSIQFSDDWIV